MARDSDYVKVLTIKGANGEEKTMQFPMKLDLERPKRPRTTFSDEQLKKLEVAFLENGYLVGQARAELSLQLGLSDTQVKVWFQNRRTKKKKTPSPTSPASSASILQRSPLINPLISSEQDSTVPYGAAFSTSSFSFPTTMMSQLQPAAFYPLYSPYFTNVQY